MNSSNQIYNKLNEFYKKFYINELLKGFLLFIGFGLLYYILTSLIENYFWFSSTFRAILFWTFIVFEIFFLLRLIIWPILKLSKITNGISHEESAKIIQNHFPSEVGDRLENLLQLNKLEKNNKSELLLASIDQKSQGLAPIPFLNAINFKSNFKYLPIAFLPLLIFAYFYLSDNINFISNSFDRVANYNVNFEKPTPFKFKILNENLTVKENEDFILEFETVGDIIPENASIVYLNQKYFAEKVQPGVFKFVFEKVSQHIPFYIEANTFSSKNFQLNLLSLPTILDLKVHVKYPSHIPKSTENNIASGNLIVPEGATVTWEVLTQNTDKVSILTDSIISHFLKNNQSFIFNKVVKNSFQYDLQVLNSSNKFVQNSSYKIDVIKDEFPKIEVQNIPDSIAKGKTLFYGKVSDDYGISNLRLVYYDIKNVNKQYYYNLPVESKLSSKFIYEFPQGLKLVEDVTYSYFFEVIDNDLVNNYKATKSQVYAHNELNELDKNEENLNSQMQQINALDKSLNQSNSNKKQANEINQMLKQNATLDYKDLKKLQDFFKSEIDQTKSLYETAKKLKEKLLEKSKTETNEKAEELQKRLENLEKEQEKNKKLYEELQKYTDKLSKEELLKQVEKAKQNSTQQKRSLEQLVEQTKRFYVEQKAEQIANKLDELAKEQNNLSEKEKASENEQNKINEKFTQIENDLKDLNKENEGLKKPLETPNLEEDVNLAKEDLQNAKQDLKDNKAFRAKGKQKSAATKMQEMSKKMQNSMKMGEMEQMEEDVKMLRQILKNLLNFSFTQEKTMKAFKSNGAQSFHFNRLLKEEQKLKNQFKFIDDSLYALASRQIKIQEVVNTNIGEIHYNIDRSLTELVDNNLSKGISHQQYVINHANILADLLSESLSNMQNQMQMQMSGQGKPKPGSGDPQLSDIIQKQQGLGEEFKKGLDNKNKGKEGEKTGNEPGSKSGNKPGDNGKEGSEGGEGESEALLEIYKEQQRLREALQKAINANGGSGDREKALEEMKKLEKNLLRKGFSNEMLNQFKNLNHELLKLETALKEQGDDDKRKSNSNVKTFNSSENIIPKSVLEYIEGTEILQKNSLPLQPKYNKLVKDFFK